MTGPPKGNAVTRVGPGTALEGHRNKDSTETITQLPAPRCLRQGLFRDRRERSAADFCRAIRAALARESRQAMSAGVHADCLEGIASAWVGRGCVP